MSFSGEVKDELADVMPKARHCMAAEARAFCDIGARKKNAPDGTKDIQFRSENVSVVRKFFTIADKAYNIRHEFTIETRKRPGGNGETAVGHLRDGAGAARLLRDDNTDNLLKRRCCRRAYLRGAFLIGGTLSDPQRYYHLEIDCPDETTAHRLKDLMRDFDLTAKTVRRKGQTVVYLKEGEQIADFLRLTGADRALLNLENIRILREMRGSVNRQVNCETANLNKTVTAAMKQMADITYLKNTGSYDRLPPVLKNMAEVRYAYPDASLTELGSHLTQPVGKSGVAHRLRRIEEAASEERRRSGDAPAE